MTFLYRKNIELLGRVPGLTYRQANLLIYVVLLPAVWLTLFWIVMAQRRTLRRLKKSLEQ